MNIGIVIPTYNERKNIQKLIPRIFKVARKNKLKIKILVVDDNSPDKTYKIVRQLAKNYDIELIQRKGKLGLGSAYITGFKDLLKEKIDIVFEMDADSSHDPEYIPDFVGKLDHGYDVVVGSRYIRGGSVHGWSIYRKLISTGGNLIARNMSGLKLHDVTSGFRAYKSKTLKKVNLNSIKNDGYAFQLEILYKVLSTDAKIAEIPISFSNRIEGKSKLSIIDIMKFAFLAFKIRFKYI